MSLPLVCICKVKLMFVCVTNWIYCQSLTGGAETTSVQVSVIMASEQLII